MTLDVPIALGLLVLFGRSIVDIASGGGEGFLDSFSGLVFFLLIGRLLQQKVFERISFERTFRSFLPLSVRVDRQGTIVLEPIERLRVGDVMSVRHHDSIAGGRGAPRRKRSRRLCVHHGRTGARRGAARRHRPRRGQGRGRRHAASRRCRCLAYAPRVFVGQPGVRAAADVVAREPGHERSARGSRSRHCCWRRWGQSRGGPTCAPACRWQPRC